MLFAKEREVIVWNPSQQEEQFLIEKTKLYLLLEVNSYDLLSR